MYFCLCSGNYADSMISPKSTISLIRFSKLGARPRKIWISKPKVLMRLFALEPFNANSFPVGPVGYGRSVIDAAKKEWTVRSEACRRFCNRYMSKRVIPDTLKDLSKFRDTKMREIDAKCTGKSLSVCYENNLPLLPSHTAPIKQWVFAQQMFGEPSAMADWIKPDWRPVLQELNIPQDRFRCRFDQEDLNLISRWKRMGRTCQLPLPIVKSQLRTRSRPAFQKGKRFEERLCP